LRASSTATPHDEWLRPGPKEGTSMPTLRVLTWNVCGDNQARAEMADKVIGIEDPDILLFQEARKTQPKLSNLYTKISNHPGYDFLYCDEYDSKGISYGGKNFYPDTTGKTYYCFYKKAKVQPNGVLGRVDYRNWLSPTGKDPNANVLTTRPPAYVELTEATTQATVLLFTWHAPLSGVGGGVFNYQAHSFFDRVATNMAAGKVGIIAGDLNATGKQIAKTYSNIFETSGHHLDHILTNKTLSQCGWYDDVKSDVHYLYLADVSW
jgi:endonuclease/exonuclease/phosphatase family metal-dependent hydrolase